MRTMLVTCPESAHLERIAYEDDAAGLLICQCTAFPNRPLSCPRTCAARLDRKREARRLAEGSVLIAVSCLRRR